MTVRTRFAPSPTGFLHIGGVRTALFNWLLARRHGGQFILRIDDTDQTRHQEEALQPILEGFQWLGLDWDEGPEVGGPHGPYFQSQRQERYRGAIERLLEAGTAYRCFCTTEQLAEERKKAEAKGSSFQGYSGVCRTLSDGEAQARTDAGVACVIRFAVPSNSRLLRFRDEILGDVQKRSEEMGDFVIARRDGSPLYNLACVVDDLDMQISHVIRAQEHLSNSWPQLLLYEALDADAPSFAHVPYVTAPGSQQKISKRALEKYQSDQDRQSLAILGFTDANAPNPVMVSYYEQLGYLPDAIINGLARIGWSLDDKQEMISRSQLIESFSLERVSSGSGSFDPEKLLWLQGEYMKQLGTAEKVAGVVSQLSRAGLVAEPVSQDQRAYVARVIESVGDRLKTFSDIIPQAGFFFRESLQYDPKAVNKTLRKPNVTEVLRQCIEVFDESEPFDTAQIERQIRSLAKSLDVGASKIIHPLRVATSGQSIGPSLFELMEILGQEKCIHRIQQTLEMLG